MRFIAINKTKQNNIILNQLLLKPLRKIQITWNFTISAWNTTHKYEGDWC